ncbi:uncharacterized protein LOC131881768 [Tigriopus californicus]|uniref:uncharacterized protein LOC131881768 n=1 Tax=Tigriopus californicus TaxID=6832 RepID=UPI0027DA0ED0|nr:uncharacterized protein LOC131881768 [Tigriopus californicus]|eukprot:TCALIF_05804-PA protein Name:"Similar to Putative endoglucanase type K (Fusarium oxysporum)" AED:0.00 eAED:0.00 QI:65/1/1/1/1/1/4/27/368
MIKAVLFFSLALAAGSSHAQDCNFYQSESDNCANGCGACFNPNGRSTSNGYDVVMCPSGESYGYYCNPEGGSFACMDWTFGSARMKQQEETFNQRMRDEGKAAGDVWFGVGTFGTTEDAMQGLGNCYRLKVRDTNCGNLEGGALLEREIIAQSINTGHDVANIQFDLQMGNGGTGAFNNCAGSSWSMFPGQFIESIWGAQYGGCSYRDSSEGSPSCDDLPELPQDSSAMSAQGDNLVDLCKYSFDKRVRLGSSNPTIVDMARVECPAELVELTQIKRSDDPKTFEITEANRPGPYQNNPVIEPCRCSCGSNECTYCLTRMMDCRKPSAGFIDNLQTNLLEDGMKVVQPCTSDGYTRIDNKCGCLDCYC